MQRRSFIKLLGIAGFITTAKAIELDIEDVKANNVDNLKYEVKYILHKEHYLHLITYKKNREGYYIAEYHDTDKLSDEKIKRMYKQMKKI